MSAQKQWWHPRTLNNQQNGPNLGRKKRKKKNQKGGKGEIEKREGQLYIPKESITVPQEIQKQSRKRTFVYVHPNITSLGL